MNSTPTTIAEAVELCRAELYSAVLCDTLDTFGFHRQVPHPPLRLLDTGRILCGTARTGLYMPVYHDDADLDVYGVEIDLVDSLKPGEVPVLICHGNTRISPWGELLSTRAAHLGAEGCITDGAVRDARIIRSMGFPVACSCTNPVDTRYRGKMMMADVPGEIGGARVAPGDLVFADEDGVVFVPAASIVEVVSAALRKARTETDFRERLHAGETLRGLFERYGIL